MKETPPLFITASTSASASSRLEDPAQQQRARPCLATPAALCPIRCAAVCELFCPRVRLTLALFQTILWPGDYDSHKFHRLVRPLVDLSRRAWTFLRGGFRPTLGLLLLLGALRLGSASRTLALMLDRLRRSCTFLLGAFEVVKNPILLVFFFFWCSVCPRMCVW